MTTHDRRYTIVYNGEIYNFPELRAYAEADGYQFCSRADTEVILAGYARFGSRIVKQLRGEYKIKAEHLRQTALLAMSMLAGFSELKVEHVPRAQNARADALANRALDAKPGG